MENTAQIRPALSPGFYELWTCGRFIGMYRSLEDARRASVSPYAAAMRHLLSKVSSVR